MTSPTPRKAVLNMAPYSPPSAGRAGKLRLDFNENTIGCSPRVIAFLTSKLCEDQLSIYPEYTRVKPALAAFSAELRALQVNPGDGVLLWKHGLGPAMRDETLRLLELRNWLDAQVFPRAARHV